MEFEEYKKCPKCGSVMKISACLKCGYIDDESAKESTLANSKKEIKSLFEQYVTQEFDMLKADTSEIEMMPTNKGRKFTLITLLIILSTTVAFISYWFFLSGIKYIAPIEIDKSLKSANVQDILDKITTTDTESSEKTFDIILDLKEGNFEKSNFAVFASNESNLYLEMFDFRHFLKNILDKNDLLTQVKKDFDMSDDDLTTFFASEFAMVFPDNNFEKWGVILKYRSAESDKFISERLETYKKLKANPKGAYVDYFIESKKNGDDTYLLISNSKIYLDEMKEFSEGNLNNLATNALYTQSIASLPKLGSVLIYKKAETMTWRYVSEFIVKKFPEYVGLDQMINGIRSQGIGVYLKEGKTKVVLSKP